MKRKFGQPTFPTLYFKDGILSVPGYTFEKAVPWQDTGSMTILAEGNSLKDGSNVIAKIAPAQSNGSMCLEREAHILGKMGSLPDAYSTALRMIDFFKIPRDNGDCVVLLLSHPGANLLGRYIPPSKVNDLLLADVHRLRTLSSHADVYMMEVEDTDLMEEMEAFDVMDLASFLEFAIQATHCLETLHKADIIHREIRANAFHLNSHSGFVRFVHFGNRAVSLENFGSPSSLVLRAYEEAEKLKVKEALCYLAPEQTGSIETMTQDHRTDLYSLGILFWTLLVGRGQMPFEGGPLELLHSIVQKRPMPVHEVRRDVPQVLASIVDKMLSKNPDTRYQSAHGLKADLLECQRRLLATVSSVSDESSELIPPFDIALEDRFMEFTMPIALFGRDKELEMIRSVIRNVSTSFSRHFSASKGFIAASGDSQDTNNVNDDHSDSITSSLSESSHNVAMTFESSPRLSSARTSPVHENSISVSMSPSLQSGDGLRRVALRSRNRVSRTQTVLIVGPAGIGKSSMILANQAKWRSHGLWGQAKFQNAESAPFAALLSCLSSVLRQLMVFQTDLRRFVTALRERLGPQLQNIPLLYQGTPELKDVLALFDIILEPPHDPLSTRELRARFQSLVESVFTVIAETRLFALFLDDLHEADESTLDLVSTLVNSRSRMLILATLRSDKSEIVKGVRSMFNNRSRPTWITVEPLPYSAISSLVSKTLHRSKEDCAPLSRFVYAASSGNAFSARSILTTLQRQRHITFDWEHNYWLYDMLAIEGSLSNQKISDPTDLTFLVSHMRELPEEARKYLTWAAFFGETFKVTEVALMMDWEDSTGSSGSDDEVDDMWNLHKAVSNLQETGSSTARGSMRGLQLALAEGWLIQRARDMCSFAHDRYRQAAQAEIEALPQETISKMSFRIILMMMHENPIDVYRVAEHAKRCLPLLHEHPKREELLDVLIDAGESAWARGAHELAIRSFVSARTLLRQNPWAENPHRTFNLLSRLAALFTWKGDLAASDTVISECYMHADQPEDQSNLLRLRSRNHWLRSSFSEALNDTLLALKILGVDVNPSPTRRQADLMFEQVKNEILAIGFDEILSIPRATDPRVELAVSLLNDAGINAYWSPSPFAFSDIIGLTTIQLALRSGMSPGTALGIFWSLGAVAEKRELYRFSADLGKLALQIADRHGSMGEKCRAQVLYCAMVSGFDNVHVRANLPRLEEAFKYGNSAGDRVYTSFASIHSILIRLYVCEHVSELIVAAEECISDVNLWAPEGECIILSTGVINCIRVLGGYTNTHSADFMFDTDTFVESQFLEKIHEMSGNVSLALNWYNSFKVVSYFCVGFVEEAAALGFYVYQTRDSHPNHRHVRYALFFHSLAMIACIRKGNTTIDRRSAYLAQIRANQTYLRKWLSPSPVNASTWIALVDAELAALLGSSDAFKLYDVAVKLAVNNDWLLEEGWALYLQGSHFVRCGVEGLGGELQRRGISRQTQWGALGIVNYLTSLADTRSQYPLKRSIFSSDAAIQTEAVAIGVESLVHVTGTRSDQEDRESTLSASDLGSILKWSKDISSDINLSSALQRLTEIATETSGSQNTCVVIAREAGDYTVATSMVPPEPCQVHENPKSIRTINDPLQKAIIQFTLNSKERVYYDDASLDSRFSSEAGQTINRSVICLPIFSNRGQTFGAVYFASKYPFPKNTVTILTLLCQQASISIANALLFRSVQAGTRENLKMIAAQREALEAARKSREDALKATKIKSNFLASMSHELRTPFSSFYGLLDLLSGTELNPGQSEIVQTAKQSCELLLKIIDSILDYSKLEASAVKLEPSGFLVENIIADCMELLLPMAAKKLDLSFNIEPDVPPWVFADYARIRQVLMNLIGNAVKFTASGFVRVICSVDKIPATSPDEVNLKFDIQDTGIGLSASDVDLLFVPFQQADNSSTRRFGGTGLGLSISRQLVKLMGGAIGVHSELNIGSMFWFTIPVKIYKSEESQKSALDLEQLKSALISSRPLRLLVCSTSDATLALLKTMLHGFQVILVSSIEDAEAHLRGYINADAPLDFVILDDQSETHADDLSHFLHSLDRRPLHDTKVIHLYTPTTSRTGPGVFGNSNIPGIVKMTKPPRKLRMLQTLAGLKNLPNAVSSSHASDVEKAIDDLAAVQRTLFGNVLIAEDNPIAQNLLVRQLERYKLNVIATSNGEEAIAEWEAHEPGYFSVALFDHHMPICDGVEATKRLRVLESKKRSPVMLPIVALSADCQDSTKQLCLSAGMNAFFSKPLRKNDLIYLLSMFGHVTSASTS
ncbi:dual-domain HisK/Mak2 protein kinase [Crucibulum laeve]|uniref:Dual-domain HisK/Mak2 protein kinase n=1 Tax=Crucibulum laeve TaxID=68775 RepID=A0A5C3M880_9AGAR|nr:dual-domain HisK/Mak2 protein kinase [Crucibulum laeve]